ncbi:MAG TPA: hypothetical protein VKY74_24370, partial [Chloroflexia bacterium]|nr:hypothetical protein [Chloroflexia bacterium]
MQHTVTRPAIAILALALLGALLGPAVQSAQLGGPGPALPPRQAVDVTATPDSGLGLDQGSAGGIVPGEVVVRFKPELGARPVSPKRAAAILGSTRALATVRRSLVDPGSYIVGVPPGSEADTAATLAADPSVASADPNLIRHIHAQRLPAPNDPLYALQWGYAQVNAPAA